MLEQGLHVSSGGLRAGRLRIGFPDKSGNDAGDQPDSPAAETRASCAMVLTMYQNRVIDWWGFDPPHLGPQV